MSESIHVNMPHCWKSYVTAPERSGSVVECLPRDRHHCVVSLSKNINPTLVLVQPRKTHPFVNERL